MGKISLSYEENKQLAVMKLIEDCEPKQKSAVRLLLEERSSSTKVNKTGFTLPWWEFIGLRDAL